RGEGAPGEGPRRAPAGAGEARARLGGILVARRGGGHAPSLDRARHRGALALAAALPRLGGSGIPRRPRGIEGGGGAGGRGAEIGRARFAEERPSGDDRDPGVEPGGGSSVSLRRRRGGRGAMSASALREVLPRIAFLRPLVEGARVLEIGGLERTGGRSAEWFAQAGARSVVSVAEEESVVAAARAAI